MASAHDAQQAAGAHLSADRRPNPPRRMGREDNCLASGSASLRFEEGFRYLPNVICHVQRNMLLDWLGDMVRIEWFALGLSTLQQQRPSALQIRDCWDGSPKLALLLNACLPSSKDRYCSDRIGVPNTVMPSGCQTSGPKSSTLSGMTPALFHALVLPWWS